MLTSSGALDVNYEVTGQWETGFNGSVTLTNTSDSKVEGWEIRFELPHEITNIWNAQKTNKDNNTYTVKNAGYNANILPKESVSFGFTATLDGEIHLPTAMDLTSAAAENSKDDYSVEYRLTNDWQTGYNAEIIITNNSDKNLEGWHLEFDYDAKIDTIWNAVIDKSENNHYSISNSDYNSVIKENWLLWAKYAAIDGLYMYTHGCEEGPDVCGGSFDKYGPYFWTLIDPNVDVNDLLDKDIEDIAIFPTLNFRKKEKNNSDTSDSAVPIESQDQVRAYFYSCDTGNGAFAQNFADIHNINVVAQTSGASFSLTPIIHIPINENAIFPWDVFLETFEVEALGKGWFNFDGEGELFVPQK